MGLLAVCSSWGNQPLGIRQLLHSETLTMPPNELAALHILDGLGESYHEHRRQIMLAQREG